MADEGKVVVGSGSADLAGESGDEGAGRDFGAFGDEGTSGDDAALADVCSVEDDGTHADEHVVFQRAAVDRGVVANRAAVADQDGMEVPHAVEDGAVLDIAAIADADGVDIATDDGVHPDGGMVAENHVAKYLGGGIDVTGGRDGGSNATEGAEHAVSVVEAAQNSVLVGVLSSPVGSFRRTRAAGDEDSKVSPATR